MSIGTKSVLFGAHQFLLHPLFVALAWWHLYGFPWDPRLWVAFFVHDLGYLGKPNMDGPEGETHPQFGAAIMGKLFDRHRRNRRCDSMRHLLGYQFCPACVESAFRWYNFTLYHSRLYARRNHAQVSRLCVADKLSTALVPRWLYLTLVNLTGEIREYMDASHHRGDGARYAGAGMKIDGSQREWFDRMREYLRAWAMEHRAAVPQPSTLNSQPE